MSKFSAKNNYVYGNEETIYIASEWRDAQKIAELMNLLDEVLPIGYDHPTVFEQRYGKEKATYKILYATGQS